MRAAPVHSKKPIKSEEVRLILKLIAPPPGEDEDEDEDEGHKRKMLSYAVEQYFYAHIAPQLPADVGVAKCLAATDDGVLGMLLTDLSELYPLAGGKRASLSEAQVHGALAWLAKFHAASWSTLPDKLEHYVRPPLQETSARGKKVWLNGGYTYLATRLSELADLAADKGSEWCVPFTSKKNGTTVAETVARALTPRGREVEVLLHGDVKSENLFTSKSGKEVAFFDFQYVGIGIGACDLAKLFTCSVPQSMLATGRIPHELGMEDGERTLLEEYRRILLESDPTRMREIPWDEFVRWWETALVDWCRFQASWGFWGNTRWLEARTKAILADEGWRAWVEKEAEGQI